MLIVGNWKAYVETLEKAKRLYATAKRLTSGTHEIVLAPSLPHLGYLVASNRSKVLFAAQDVSVHAGGAATGEVTASLLANMRVSYVIIGHSERRAMGETDLTVSEKVRLALAQGLTPIVCIGETERDPEARYLSRLRTQIDSVFSSLSEKDRRGLVIAYEPIWAIGKAASSAITPSDLTEMVLYLRKLLGEYLPGKGNQKVRILYGGSVEPVNARTLAAATGIDGFLIGRASTDTTMFGALVKAVS